MLVTTTKKKMEKNLKQNKKKRICGRNFKTCGALYAILKLQIQKNIYKLFVNHKVVNNY